MVKIYLLPADEGDFIWIRYGKGEKYANIIVDGGTKSSGKEYAEVIENIAERGEKVEALVLPHIDYDLKLRTLISAYSPSANPILNVGSLS